MKEFDIKKEIIGFLGKKRENFVSGEEISASLGFSRACAWKYIKKLREEGYIIEASPRRGYRLSSAPDKLYGYGIACRVGTKTMGKGVFYHYESIPSTNDRAYELAEKEFPEGTVVAAEAQTRGKGRMGRKWISPKTGGIYVSIILRPDVEIDIIPTITLVAAASVVKAIREKYKLKAGIKWPNDILVNGRKVCGILTEIKAQPDRVDFLILGIGINVNTPAGQFPAEGTSLKAERRVHMDRSELLGHILEVFEGDYRKFQKEGFSPLRDECKSLSVILGKKVKIGEKRRTVSGRAVDIDEKGALIVRTDDGVIRRVFSGDVTF